MHCLALFTGGLDSALAVRLVQRMGVTVELVFFDTPCARHRPGAEQAAALGAALTIIQPDSDYCRAACHPILGRGKGAAACLDCRVWMLRRAALLADQRQAEFVITGEVVGQRPHSQNRRELEAVAYHSGLEERLVRPLSAQLLPETEIERRGALDRSRLGRLHGSARREQLALARELELPDFPSSQAGCAFAERVIAARMFDLIGHGGGGNPADFALLRLGRHYRMNSGLKIVVGRNAEENARMLAIASGMIPTPVVVRPIDFTGPTVLAVGTAADAAEVAASFLQRYGESPDLPLVQASRGETTWSLIATGRPEIEQAQPIGATSRRTPS